MGPFLSSHEYRLLLANLGAKSLALVGGATTLRSLPLPEGSHTVGSAPGCSVRLPGSSGETAFGRREAAALLASSMAAVLTGGTQAASAGAGTIVKLDLAVKTYVEVECPESLAQGRAGGALGAGAGGGGIAQKCVQVKVRPG